eukprot:SAG11_NODE_9518_length_904_cov_1.245963_1_plen_121_part_01
MSGLATPLAAEAQGIKKAVREGRIPRGYKIPTKDQRKLLWDKFGKDSAGLDTNVTAAAVQSHWEWYDDQTAITMCFRILKHSSQANGMLGWIEFRLLFKLLALYVRFCDALGSEENAKELG